MSRYIYNVIKRGKKLRKNGRLTFCYLFLVPHQLKVVKDLDSVISFPKNLNVLRDDLVCQMNTGPFDVIRKNVHLRLLERPIHTIPQIRLGQCGPLSINILFPNHSNCYPYLEREQQQLFYGIFWQVLKEVLDPTATQHLRPGIVLPNTDKCIVQLKTLHKVLDILFGKLQQDPHLIIFGKNLKLGTKGMDWIEVEEYLKRYIVLKPEETFLDVAREILPVVDTQQFVGNRLFNYGEQTFSIQWKRKKNQKSKIKNQKSKIKN